MSDSSFNTVVVRDSRINDVSTKIDYIVSKEAAQNNYQHVKSTSAGVTNVNFAITVPSENILVDRNITISAKPTFRVTIPAGLAANTVAFKYGSTEALNQFPLNSLFTNATATINQASFSVNTQDMLHTLIRMTDDEVLSKYNCPYMSDKGFRAYSDMAELESNPLAGFDKAKGSVVPRGSHPIEFSIVTTRNGAAASAAVTHANTGAQILAALTSGHVGDSWVIDISFQSTEPLLFLSPFLTGEGNNNSAGLYGVRNMDFVFNVDTSAKRLLCSGSTVPMTIVLTAMNDCYLNLNYLSTQASDLLSSRNVVPFSDYSRFLTVSDQVFGANASNSINAHAVQLSQIPNRLYVVARKPINSQTMKDSNAFLAIEGISVNFNNVAGILANANSHDLYKLSIANGSKQDLYEFLGGASIANGVKKNTTGSILVLNPARDLSLPDYLSNGSIGQFSFQANVRVRNLDAVDVTPEILIIAEYDGFFLTEAGQSMKQTGLLTKDLVVNSTMAQFGESSNYIESHNKANGSNLSASSMRNVPLLNMKKSEKSGGAYSGGAMSGGAMSGGARSGGCPASNLRNFV
jgi:hypothetical protein